MQRRIQFKVYLILGVLLLSLNSYGQKKSSDVLKKLQYTSDENLNQMKAIKTEILVSESEQKAIRQIKKLLRKYKGTPLEVDMMFRLAELYMRRAKSALFFEVNRKGNEAASFTPAKLKSRSSKNYVFKAIKIYDSIQKRFKNYGDMDLVLFNEALACQQVSQEKKAEQLYWKIIKRHNSSPLVPDAHLAIGELAFKQKRFKHALNHFESVKKYPDSRVYPYGLYKAAWTQYNLHNAPAGMKELEAVVKYGVYVQKEGIDARLDLRREALSDMAIFFEDVYTPEKAYDYFKEQAGDLPYSDYILKLGHIYDRHSAYKNLEIVYTEFTSRDPYNPDIPKVRDELVWNYENMRVRELAVEQLKAFQKVCRKESSWFKKNTESLEKPEERLAVFNECQNKLDGTSIRLAQKWLRMWKKNPTHPVFAQSSEQAFKIYLDFEKKTEEYKKARYVYAELLFQQKKYRMATKHYELASLYFKGDKKNKKLAHDSSYAAVLSLEKAVEVEKSKWKNKDEALFKKLVKHYVSTQPKGKYKLDVEFKMALIAYEKERYDEAGKTFKRLGAEFAGTDKGLKAQDLYLDILNIQKDYTKLKTYANGLLKKRKALSVARKSKLTQVYEESYFLEVQSLDESSQSEKAILEYKKFAKENKSSKLAPQAWVNAMNLQFKSGDLVGGSESAEEYSIFFPKQKDAQSALVKAASTYEQLGMLQRATIVLLKLAKLDKNKWDYWTNLAADYLLLSEKPKSALGYYQKIANDQKSKKKERVHALFQITEALKDQGDGRYNKKVHFEYLNKLYQEGVQPYSGQAYLTIVEDLFVQKKYPKAFSESRSLLGLKGNSAYVNAKARFIQAEILHHEFSAQSLKTSIDRVAMVIQLKSERMDKAQRAYQSAIRFGDPETSVQALLRLSDLYIEYVSSLRAMPIPRDLPKEAEMAFRGEIENLSVPIEEKGIETLNQAYKQVIASKLYNGQVDKIKAALDKANLRSNHLPTYSVALPKRELPMYFVGVQDAQ